MEIILKLDLDIVAIIALTLLLIYGNRGLTRERKEYKLYRNLIQTTLVVLILEVLDVWIGIYTDAKWITVHQLVNCAGFYLAIVVGYLWVSHIYSYFKIHKVPRLLKVPLYINGLLLVVNFKTPIVFQIDASNQYARGDLFFLPIFLTYIYLAWGIGIFFKENKKRIEATGSMMICISLIPFVAMTVQIINSEILCVWPAITGCLIAYYIYLQDQRLRYDSLTKAWTRGAFQNYIEDEIAAKRKFALGLIDLDDFKRINDTYGHQEGDQALILTVELIRSELGKGNHIVRWGGDEFIIVIHTEEICEIERILQNMEEKCHAFNKQASKPYKLRWSAGYGIYDEKVSSLEELLTCIDEGMYERKASAKQSRQFKI